MNYFEGFGFLWTILLAFGLGVEWRIDALAAAAGNDKTKPAAVVVLHALAGGHAFGDRSGLLFSRLFGHHFFLFHTFYLMGTK